MSCAAFAREIGVSKMAVSIAIRDRRLLNSVTYDNAGNPKIADPDLARKEWAANTSLGHVHRSPEHAAAAASRGRWVDVSAPIPGEVEGDATQEPDAGASPQQRKAHWEALIAERKLRETAGELVPAAEVEAALTETFTTCKTRLLAIPSRAKQEIPALTLDQLAVLERLVREACEELRVTA